MSAHWAGCRCIKTLACSPEAGTPPPDLVPSPVRWDIRPKRRPAANAGRPRVGCCLICIWDLVFQQDWACCRSKRARPLLLPLHSHPSWPELWEPLHALASVAKEASG